MATSSDHISFTEYSYIMNRIAYWLVNNNKKFNVRQVYGYMARTADYGTIIKTIKERGTNYGTDALISEFVECAIHDNSDLSFLPNYVSGRDGTKYYKDNYVDMARRVSEYEVKKGISPAIIYLNNNNESSSTSSSKKYGFLLSSGCGNLGQCNGYNCGPHSLMQAYYNLTGYNVSEKTLASACGTTTSGTSHQGLATGLAWLNKKYGTNITMEWKDFSDVGWSGLNSLLNDNNSTVFWHELYRSQWGHYSLANKISTTLNVLNSLGSKCNAPAYCGYQESRSQATQRTYWNGISQKSICILRRK